MLNPRIKFTYQDYLLLPEGDRRELVHGDFYMVPAPSIRHQDILANISVILRRYVNENNTGKLLWSPVDVVFTDKDVVQPDILYISNERRDIITEANISGAPDLVIEILSPGTADRDRQLKLRLYARHGVSEYWIVDPDERSVQIMELGPEGYDKIRSLDSGEIASSVLPGLSIGIDDVFAGY
jgi:Uma2 family endonuclease